MTYGLLGWGGHLHLHGNIPSVFGMPSMPCMLTTAFQALMLELAVGIGEGAANGAVVVLAASWVLA